MLLLDSAVVVWLLVDSPRLGNVARDRIRRATVTHFSAASITELTIKSMLGKITIPLDLLQASREAGLVELPLTAEHAAAIREFPSLTRHDPFDRLLVAQAFVEGCEFVTSDRVLLDLEIPFVVDATL